MKFKQILEDLPEHFKKEKAALYSFNICSWNQLQQLTDKQLMQVMKEGLLSKNNLEKLRNIANLICELNIPLNEAFILIHSGISSINAISRCSPQELTSRTGRLERQLGTTRETIFSLKKANSLILLAKSRQKQN